MKILFYSLVLLFLISLPSHLQSQTFTVMSTGDGDDNEPPYTLREAIRFVNESPLNNNKIIEFELNSDGDPTDLIFLNDQLPFIQSNNVTINGINQTTSNKVIIIGGEWIQSIQFYSEDAITFGDPGSPFDAFTNNHINNMAFDGFLLPLRFWGVTDFSASDCEFYNSRSTAFGGNSMIECNNSKNGVINNNLILPNNFGNKPDGVSNTKGVAAYNCQNFIIDANAIHLCDQAIEFFNTSDMNITNNITRELNINFEIYRYPNFYFCIVGNSENITFGGPGQENEIYGLDESLGFDTGISCDASSNIIVLENSFDCLSSPISNYSATITIDHIYQDGAGGTGTPGEIVYVYQSGNFTPTNNDPVCNYCDNGYLYIGSTEVADDGTWCLEYPSGFTLSPNDNITAYSIQPPFGSSDGNTSDFVTGCYSADDNCPNITISIDPTITSCIQLCVEANVLENGGPISSPEWITYTWFPPGGGVENGSEVCAFTEGLLSLQVDYKCCIYQANYQLEFPNLDIVATGTEASCGNSNGTITVQAVGGQSPFVYTITGPPNQTSGSVFGATYTFFNVPAGTYTATVTDSYNCSANQSITINSSTGPVLNFNTVDASCGQSNGSATVNAVNGQSPYEYLWSTGSTNATINNLSMGEYFVTVTDNNNCVVTGSVNIFSSDGPVVSITKTDATCGMANGTANASATGGLLPYNFAWSNGSFGPNIIGLLPGLYSVTVTDANNCTGTQSVTINSTGGPDVSISKTDANCGVANGSATATPSAGSPPYTYLWSTGSTNATITSLNAGIYTVTVTDSENCATSQDVEIINIGGPVVNITKTDANCGVANGSATAIPTGGSLPFSYLWSTGSTDQTINNLIAGVYSVTVTDNSNCATSQTVEINNIGGPNVTVNTTDANCGVANGSAEAMVTGGASPYDYLWSTGSTLPSITGLAAGNYSLTVTDAAGCISVTDIVINNIGGPAVVINKTDSDCSGANGSANAVASGGTLPYNYLWSTGATTQSISGLLPGSYTVTVTDGTGCITTETTIINSNGGPTSTFEVDNTTCGLVNGSVILTILNGSQPFDYSISGASTMSSENINVNNFNFTGLQAGSYIYNIQDAGGCTTEGSFIINSSTEVSFNPVQSGFECGQATGIITLIVVNGTGPYTFLLNDENLNNTGIFTGLIPGEYLVSVIDSRGCRADSTLASNISFEFNAVTDTVIMDFYSNPVEFDPLDNDEITGTGFTVTPVNSVVLNGGNQMIGTLTNQSASSSTFEFYFHGSYDGQTNTYTLNYPFEQETMQYLLCFDQCPGACDTGTIILLSNYRCIDNNGGFVNTFTPNGDGRNDVLVLPQFPECNITGSEIGIYNRWGEKVFSRQDYGNNWDGLNNGGTELPEGTYYYVLNIKTSDGKQFVIKNFIELLR